MRTMESNRIDNHKKSYEIFVAITLFISYFVKIKTILNDDSVGVKFIKEYHSMAFSNSLRFGIFYEKAR